MLSFSKKHSQTVSNILFLNKKILFRNLQEFIRVNEGEEKEKEKKRGRDREREREERDAQDSGHL